MSGSPATARSRSSGGPCSILQGADTDPRPVEVLRQAVADDGEACVTLLNYRKDGTPFWNEVAIAPQRDDRGRVVRYLGVQKDVTLQIQAEQRIHELAYYDSLTHLANRAALHDELEARLDLARASGGQIALLFIDLDDFKTVNDTHGHASGDMLLQAVAHRLGSVVRPTDLLARPGGDEFLLLLGGLGDMRDTATDLANRVVDCFKHPFLLPAAGAVSVRASVGISTFPRDADSTEDLLGHADVAMYVAKAAGKDGYQVFAPRPRKSLASHSDDFEPAAAVDELDRILANQAITPVFQPIVDIASSRTIGYEALARGPEGSPLQRPDLLFATAEAAGRTVELDWLCRIRAVQSALAAGLGRSATLFVNCEPSAMGSACPPVHAETWDRAQRELDLVIEITERAVTDRPAELSRLVSEHRANGRGVALDDLGADIRSLALLPFIAPEVIKLDLRLVQERPSTEQAAIVSAVSAEGERTGAAILAEGIETDEHLEVARTLGATLGQGWLWGRPGPLLGGEAFMRWRRPRVASTVSRARTPFEVVRERCFTGPATKRLLMPMSRHLENRALHIGEGAVLLSAFQDAAHFTRPTVRRYEILARGASLVAAFGVGLPNEPAPDVRGAPIAADDPLAGEWSVIVIGPHFAGALVAQDLGDQCRQSERRFEFATTYQRDLVIAAARTLLERITPISVTQPVTAPTRVA